MKSSFIEEAAPKSANRESEIGIGISVEAFRIVARDVGRWQWAVDRIVAPYVPIDLGAGHDI